MKRTNQLADSKLIALMDKIPFFVKFTLSERTQMAQFAQIYIADTDEAIIEKGATDTCFYVMLTGSANVCLEYKETSVASVAPGGIFGEIGFVLNIPRTTWVTANQMCAVLRVDQTLLNSLDYSVREKVKDQIIFKLARNIEDINSRMF